MTELLATSDFHSLSLLGHDMRSTGLAYGFPELTRQLAPPWSSLPSARTRKVSLHN